MPLIKIQSQGLYSVNHDANNGTFNGLEDYRTAYCGPLDGLRSRSVAEISATRYRLSNQVTFNYKVAKTSGFD
jgi:hypothetical protein